MPLFVGWSPSKALATVIALSNSATELMAKDKNSNGSASHYLTLDESNCCGNTGKNEHTHTHTLTQGTGNSVLKSLALPESPAGFIHPIDPVALFTMSAQPARELTISTAKTGVTSLYLFNSVAQAGISN